MVGVEEGGDENKTLEVTKKKPWQVGCVGSRGVGKNGKVFRKGNPSSKDRRSTQRPGGGGGTSHVDLFQR